MQTYMVLCTLLTFSSANVSAGLQEALTVVKCIADIQQALPSSCLFIINSEGDVQGEKCFIFFLARIVCFAKNMLRFCDISLLRNAFLKRIGYT
jgi:hypothetical protein